MTFMVNYRRHCTETTLSKVVSDIRLVFDETVLLDLIAAIYVVDYKILVGSHTNRLGIRGVVLRWLNSYLLYNICNVCN